ncbi:MAG: hypothetical protein JWM56_107 [Candidatus Peribacteria bacterium]|nr:hypothetical protein [Candidatus Peribacteria bacterium]
MGLFDSTPGIPADTSSANKKPEKKDVESEKQQVIAYGFEAADLNPPSGGECETKDANIHFINFFDSADYYKNANGVIIPSGIFDKIEQRGDGYGHVYSTITCKDYDMVYEKEKQLLNHLKDGGWICFLVTDTIIDSYTITYAYGHNSAIKSCNDTDLCKRLLNIYGISRKSIDVNTQVSAKRDEFIPLMREFGIAKNSFILREAKGTPTVLAEVAGSPVGLTINGNLFFLPIHYTRASDAKKIAEAVTGAIIKYRKDRATFVPLWIKDLKFNSEHSIAAEILKLESALLEQRQMAQVFDEYKTILVTQSDTLRNEVASILKDFFGLNAVPMNENVEDIKIIDGHGQIQFLMECKGTNSGVTREYINQTDSFRERNNLTITIPAILMINNEKKIESIEKRQSTKVVNDQIKKAVSDNILIIRTIDLLFLMKQYESLGISERKDGIKKLFNSGGGWLKVNDTEHHILKSIDDVSAL